MHKVECVVIGAGVVGLAIARELARSGREVVVLEAADSIGTGTSSRNSEVIHAGIYYPSGSLKARLCVEGRQALYAFCASHGVEHRRLGKIIVASRDEEIAILDKYCRLAKSNGVDDLVRLQREDLRELEPAITGVAGLLSPSTGIVDSYGLMLALQGDAETAGATFAFRSRVVAGQATDRGVELTVAGVEPTSLLCEMVINSAGLHAQEVAHTIAGVMSTSVPPQFFAKAHYFTFGGRSPFRRLVYPVPVPGGLGTHVTLDLAGRARFGPDVQWIEKIDYSFDESRAPSFYESIRHYYPALQNGQLQPGYTGIRPKISASHEPPADFMIQGSREHGVPGLVNLYGIESPGLTAALAIASYVAKLLETEPIV